jgi:hypothetical protein
MERSVQDFLDMIQARGEKEAFLNWTRNALGMGAEQEGALGGKEWFLFYDQWVKTVKPGFKLNTQAKDQITILPHPEEPMNPLATLANTDVVAVITKWLIDWGVPAQYWDYWKSAIDMQVYDIYPPSVLKMGLKQDTPAAAWESAGRRHMAIKPNWLNPGVIAHEQAHNSYALLTSSQKAAFSTVYAPLKSTDPLIKLLYSKNTYGLTNDVEGHAEVYRYIGKQMPAQLTMYYPRLF